MHTVYCVLQFAVMSEIKKDIVKRWKLRGDESKNKLKKQEFFQYNNKKANTVGVNIFFNKVIHHVSSSRAQNYKHYTLT